MNRKINNAKLQYALYSDLWASGKDSLLGLGDLQRRPQHPRPWSPVVRCIERESERGADTEREGGRERDRRRAVSEREGEGGS